MQTLFAVVVVVLVPYVAIMVLLALTRRVERRREERRLRQIALTEAIHRELGAVVAPVVEKRPWGPWRLRIAVPSDRPALASEVVSVAQRAVAAMSPLRFEIVLVPRRPAVAGR
jgi:hypothetical protein